MHVSLSVILAAGLLQTGSGELIEELDAAPPRTGFIMLAESPARLLGDSAAQNLDAILPADEPVQWHVYVPHGYSAGKPPGVLVFVSSIDWGGIPEDWIPLMDEHNLIWISPGSAGRSVPAQQRVMKAVLAPHAISREFQVDTRRIFVGGFSDGGKIAGLVETADPAVFMGGLFVCGAIAWGNRTPAHIDVMRTRRYVFVRGCFDPKEREVKDAHTAYLDAGMVNSKLITVQTRRQRLPQRNVIDAAIRYLDSIGTDESGD